MTRERLEELIKQKGIVYCPMNLNGFIVEYDLSVFRCQIASDDEKVFACIFNADYEGGCYHLCDVFETRERALWSAKIRANRIEIFDPPMWEDVKEYYQFCWLNKSFDLFYFEVIDDRDIILVGKVNGKNLFAEKATKENYIKACEMVRDLFNKRGEK